MLRFKLIFLVQILVLNEICFSSDFLNYSPFRREEFVKDNGYPFEIHMITTTDGYIIDIDRIPYGNHSLLQPNKTRPVVLVQSVGCADSSTWLVMGPNKSLPFLLADHGFDVWIGNYRGSTFGRKHVNLHPDSDQNFWDFSFHEYGIYDLRNTIDFILNKTNHSNLTYISHSLGAASFLVLVSEEPEYNSKIKLSVLYGPTVYFQGAPTLYSKILKNYHFLQFPLIASSYPGGSSVKLILMLGQYFRHGRFAKFDYGKKDNMNTYGQAVPPSYELSNVHVPVILYRGTNDAMTPYVNVEKLANQLPNTIALFNVSSFDHASFLWAGDLSQSVYLHTINMLLK